MSTRATVVNASALTINFGDGNDVAALGLPGVPYEPGAIVMVISRDGAGSQPVVLPFRRTP